MRTRAALGSIFASVAVLVIGWQAGSAALASSTTSTSTSQPQAGSSTATTPSDSSSSSSSSTDSGSSSSSSGSSSSGASSSSGSSSGAKNGTYTGSSVSTRYGNVQVSVTIASGKITDVTAVHLTDSDGRSVQISNQAAPILRSEVLAAQSAKVSNVGGATYTTQGYLTSLQSALDQAGF